MLFEPSALAEAESPLPPKRPRQDASRRASSWIERLLGRAAVPLHARAGLLRGLMSLAAALAEMGAIVVTSVIAGVAFHVVAHGELGIVPNFIEAGTLIAVFFVAPNASRHAYSLENVLAFPHGLRRAFSFWNVAFFLTIGIGFMMRASADFSRGWAVLAYLAGFAAVVIERLVLAELARDIVARGIAPLRRVFLVGREVDVEAFRRRCEDSGSGLRIVGAALLREVGEPQEAPARAGQLAEDIRLAVSVARFNRPEDVFIILPWSERETIERCVDAFLTLPASIHLDPEKVLSRFEDLRISRLGSIVGINLASEPLTLVDIVLKRLFDIAVSGAALILLAPFFAAVAILIKLDSSGPVLFVQRRHGFNQEPYPIFKFRSMTVNASQGGFLQATKDDARITRLGRFLRRWNIDELPQLLNVLHGQMSLVGPRPHALSHDRAFEERVALYARRHNVKPGITGWAQINGLRGPTATDEQMRRRVECDLYYIDNWSFWLDMKILILTVLSPKAYRNAH